MYKIYKLVGYEPYWNTDGSIFPRFHIETLVNNSNGTIYWQEIPKKVEYSTIAGNLTFIDKFTNDYPQYLKVVDNSSTMYWFNPQITTVAAVDKNDDFNYQFNYSLDIYMSYYIDILQKLYKSDLDVKVFRTFTDRFLVDWNNQTIHFNAFQQKQFLNYEPHQFNNQKNFLYSTSAKELLEKNGINFTSTYSFINKTNPNQSIDLKGENLCTPNHNNRFRYIVCYSTAFKFCHWDDNKGLTNKTVATNDFFIIPICDIDDINGGHISAENIIKVLQNPHIPQNGDSDGDFWTLTAMAQNEFIEDFECDIPHSIIINWAKDNGALEYCVTTYDEQDQNGRVITSTANIYLARIPYNTHIPFIIKDYNTTIVNDWYKQDLPQKLENILIDPTNITEIKLESEPYILHPELYKEMCAFTTTQCIINELTNFDFSTNWDVINHMYLWGNICFDGNVKMIYQYKDINGKDCMNYNNPQANNNFSNLTSEIGLKCFAMGSSRANFNDNNMANEIVARGQARRQLTNSIVSLGANLLGQGVDMGADINQYQKDSADMDLRNKAYMSNRMSMISKGMKVGPKILESMNPVGLVAQGITSAINTGLQAWNIHRQFEQAKVNINTNIAQSSSMGVGANQSATLDTFIPNKCFVEGTYLNKYDLPCLFNTFAYQPNIQDYQTVFNDIQMRGYPYNGVMSINKIFNRQIYNILDIDTSYNTDQLIRVCKLDKPPFVGLARTYEFLTWLGMEKRIYNSWYLSKNDILNNIEIRQLPYYGKEPLNSILINFNPKVGPLLSQPTDLPQLIIDWLKVDNPNNVAAIEAFFADPNNYTYTFTPTDIQITATAHSQYIGKTPQLANIYSPYYFKFNDDFEINKWENFIQSNFVINFCKDSNDDLNNVNRTRLIELASDSGYSFYDPKKLSFNLKDVLDYKANWGDDPNIPSHFRVPRQHGDFEIKYCNKVINDDFMTQEQRVWWIPIMGIKYRYQSPHHNFAEGWTYFLFDNYKLNVVGSSHTTDKEDNISYWKSEKYTEKLPYINDLSFDGQALPIPNPIKNTCAWIFGDGSIHSINGNRQWFFDYVEQREADDGYNYFTQCISCETNNQSSGIDQLGQDLDYDTTQISLSIKTNPNNPIKNVKETIQLPSEIELNTFGTIIK